VSNTTFAADVKRFADMTEKNLLNVARESIQDVIADAQTPVAKGGKMPVDTAFLRNSLVSGLNGGFENAGPEAYVLTIANMKLGDTSKFGWTAEYAEHQEYGTSKMTGRHFASSAAARWQEFVNRNAARVK
jgi:hypothetical protein